jgi:tetratricopeptide (TPR) repeat protein
MMARQLLAVLVLLVLAAPDADAQAVQQRTLAARAFDLERSGNYVGAVAAYRALLADEPGLVSALLGLERSLGALSRLPEMSAELAAVMALPEPPLAVFPVAVRVWTAAGLPDSARRVVDRWAQLEPGSEAPWQEWGFAASARRDFVLAREILTTGRSRLGRPDALATELAHLASLEEDYPTAVAEWVRALRTNPVHRAGAVALLGQAPAARRAEILSLLGAGREPVAARVAAVLTARWGDPVAGFDRLQAALPADREARIEELSHFREEISGSSTAAGRRAEGMVLEALGELSEGETATRHWLDAAQAYSDAGAADAARRTLSRLAQTSGVPPEVAGRATVTLVGVLVEEGRLAEADRQLADLREALGVEDLERLGRRVAIGWLRQGNLGRAAELVAADSSVEGLDLSGRIRVYQGDLAGGAELLRAAGPFAGSREEATGRLRYLALLQVIESDSLPALGEGLLLLEQGDTAAAAARLETVGAELPPAKGGAEVALLAGRLWAALGRTADAERVLARASHAEAPAASAAAGLELARIEDATGRRAEAMVRLEALIVAWPGSAVAPDARRLLDQLRGAVPAGR